MSYRPYGHATIDPSRPRARAVCDRCGQIWNLENLIWQFDWRGPRVQNLRVLVCPPCYDKPQMNGQRTYILPPDPVPVMNARPEFRVPEDNPLSALGATPSPLSYVFGNQIGNMVNYAGVPAAFDSNVNKPTTQCAGISVSNSSYNNYVGINWTGNTFSINAPSSLQYPIIKHSILTVSVTAPNDSTFGSTSFVVQGCPVEPAPFGAWTTIYTGTPLGVVGETVTGACSGGEYQFHRVAFLGNGGQIAVAQVEFNVGEEGSTT